MTHHDQHQRQLPYRSPLTITLALLCVAFLGLGIRGILLPQAGALSLGGPLQHPDELWLMQTTAARNIGISLLAAGLICMDCRRPIGALLGTATLISALDFFIVLTVADFASAVKHLGYFAILGCVAWITLRKSRFTD